jgi:hypothetical protein
MRIPYPLIVIGVGSERTPFIRDTAMNSQPEFGQKFPNSWHAFFSDPRHH